MKTKSKDISNYLSYKFLGLNTTQELAQLLNFEYTVLVNTVKLASYTEFTIPKAKGGKRSIEAPDEYLLFLQKRINYYLQAVYTKIKPEVVHGFVKNHNKAATPKTIITNAKCHIDKKYLLNIDLKDFFHSVSAVMVRDLFQKAPFNFSENLATCVALICCWNKRLPMGAPTSPIVANLYCLALDNCLIALAQKHNFVYTRYADDLTFSSDSKFDDDAIAEIKNCIDDNDFIINERKLRLQSKYRKQTVTGIKVNEKLNVDRHYIRNIRAALHDIKLNGVEKAAVKHYNLNTPDSKLTNTLLLRLAGKINFIGQVRGKSDLIYNKLRQELEIYQFASV